MRQFQFTNYRTGHETRMNFETCYLHTMHDGETDPTLIPFSDETWYHLARYITSQFTF